MKTKKNVIIFIHVCAINHYLEVVEFLLKAVWESGLYADADKIVLSTVGDAGKIKEIYASPPPEKITVIDNNCNINHFEFPTLQHLQQYARENDAYILYMHTKGVSRPGDKNMTDWMKLMSYFSIYQYKKCIEGLESHLCCGVNLIESPYLHFSGNFWWANSEYIRLLPDIKKNKYFVEPVVGSLRHNAEFWIGVNARKEEMLELHNSQTNHYHNLYSPANYVSTEHKTLL